MNSAEDQQLIRGMGLLQATAANMLEMIGIGPFITIPLIIAAMGGPQAMIGWLLGAVISMCDGLVWAELGAAMPGTGGSYHYLRQAYGPNRLGSLMSFLFIWQTVCSAPFSIASGAVGFAKYAGFFSSSLIKPGGELSVIGKLLAAALCLAVTALLYRDIHSVGRLSVAMWAVVLLTVGWALVAGLMNFQPRLALDFPPDAFKLSTGFFMGLGVASLNAVYDYGGYNNVCLFAGEVKKPERIVPRAILLSIGAVVAIYLTMTITIIGVVPWREAMHSQAIVADFIQRIYGGKAASVMTVLILCTTFASIFAVMLGYSRVPYAAAADGRFFKPFARLHPTKHFPTFSLLLIGISSALACWFDLAWLITALIVIQIIARDIAQVFAVTLIRRLRPEIKRPFKMWLYPAPSLIALAGWIYILGANGLKFILLGIGLMAVGIVAYLWQASAKAEWPFAAAIPKM